MCGLAKTSAAVLVAMAAMIVPAQAQDLSMTEQAPFSEPTETERGSIAGRADSVFGASQLSRGTFSLPIPISLPSEEGAPLWDIFPQYSPDAGLSEWGMGWKQALSIRRFRYSGDVQFSDNDLLFGPWGVMSPGDDGYFYSNGFSSFVRVTPPLIGPNGGTLTAFLPDGRKATFTEQVSDKGQTDFEWWLTSVEDPLGRRTEIQYLQPASAYLNRMLVDEVTYGGATGSSAPYRIKVRYEASAPGVGTFLTSYVGGFISQVAFRVRAVDCFAHDQLRWRYALAYQTRPDVQAVFYLSSVTKVFASGDKLPPATFTYDLRDVADATVTQTDPLPGSPSKYYDDAQDGVLDFVTNDFLFDSSTCVILINCPGRFEYRFFSHRPGEPYAQTKSLLSTSVVELYAVSALVPGTKDYLIARHTDREIALPTAHIEPYFTFSTVDLSSETSEATITWFDDFRPVSFVDIDGDRRPDMLYSNWDENGHIWQEARFNRSDRNTGIVFEDPVRLAFLPEAVSQLWVADVNGDGRLDILTRYRGSSAMDVFLRAGPLSSAGAFVRVPVRFSGPSASLLTGTNSIRFGDFNNDGMIDIFFWDANWVAGQGLTAKLALFMNNGMSSAGALFVEASISGLSRGYPTIGDFTGDGNVHARVTGSAVDGTLGQFDVQYTRASTGLLIAFDDGAGRNTTIEYGRAPPTPGITHRPRVISKVTVTAVGEPTRKYSYSFAGPVLHSEAGTLLGYTYASTVTSNADDTPFLYEDNAFLLGTSIPQGILFHRQRTGTETTEAPISLAEHWSYDFAPLFGKLWMRLASHTTAISGTVVAVDSYSSYQGPCPTHVEAQEEGSSGTQQLTEDRTYASPVKLNDSITCIPATITRSVSPGSTSAAQKVAYAYNDAGQLTQKVKDPDSPSPLVDTTVSYFANGTVANITRADRGTTIFAYDRPPLVARKVLPDGRTIDLSDIDPVSDAPRSLSINGYVLSFAYDRFERLVSAWDNTAGGFGGDPLLSVSYRIPTRTALGSIFTSSLVNAASNARSSVVRLMSAQQYTSLGAEMIRDDAFIADLLEPGAPVPAPRGFLSADPIRRPAKTWADRFLRRLKSVTTLQATSSGWSSAGVALAESLGVTREYLPAVPVQDPFAVSLEGLASTNTLVHEIVTSGLGFAISETENLHADVKRRVAYSSLAPTPSEPLSAAGLLVSATENEMFTTKSEIDVERRVVGFSDQEGKVGRYTYNAFGQLVSVALPDETASFSLAYDGKGRVSSITWMQAAGTTGALQIAYTYDDVTGLLRKKDFSVDGASQRSVFFDYDSIGRRTLTVYTDANGNQTSHVSFYDGSNLDNPNTIIGSQLGFLTGVAGSGFAKSYSYRPDGRLERTLLNVAGQRAVNSTFRYFDDGTLERLTTDALVPRLEEPACMAQEIDKVITVDTFGRPNQLFINAALFADITYDQHGRVDTMALSDGSVVEQIHDPLTFARLGFRRVIPSDKDLVSIESSVRFNDRGFIGSEKQGAAFGPLPGTVAREYGYWPQGGLHTSIDTSLDVTSEALHDYTYTVDSTTQLLNEIQIDHDHSKLTLDAKKKTLRYENGSKATVFGFDPLGRVSSRWGAPGDITFNYGPDGQIANTSTGVEYLYDEAGLRISKTSDGKVVVYADTGVLGASGLTEPITLAGVEVGLYAQGVFTSVPTDIRGTVLRVASGANFSDLPSPFGARGVHPDVAEATEYARSGFDPETGLVRMGVRDYDPLIGRFLQPDPLYLEAPKLCEKDHAGCNLYSYARNSPATFVDPTGLYIVSVDQALLQYLRQLSETDLGSTLIQRIEASPVPVHLTASSSGTDASLGQAVLDDWGTIWVNVDVNKIRSLSQTRNPAVTLGHELFHAFEFSYGILTTMDMQEPFKTLNLAEDAAHAFSRGLDFEIRDRPNQPLGPPFTY